MGRRARSSRTPPRGFRNIQHEPRVVLIDDPDNPYRFIEVRGDVVSIEPDPGAAFYKSLQTRYGESYEVKDADVRVILTVACRRPLFPTDPR